MPETLIAAELFGYEKGASTGAQSRDEIGDLSVLTQIKLLRVLQERGFKRLGSTTSLKVNVRLAAATNWGEEITQQPFHRSPFRHTIPANACVASQVPSTQLLHAGAACSKASGGFVRPRDGPSEKSSRGELNPQSVIESTITEDDGTARDKVTRVQFLGELVSRQLPATSRSRKGTDPFPEAFLFVGELPVRCHSWVGVQWRDGCVQDPTPLRDVQKTIGWVNRA